MMGPHRAVLRQWANLTASVVVPFVSQAVWLIVHQEFELGTPNIVGVAIYGIDVLLGFAFLVYELRWYSLALAPFYLVLMPLMLVGFSLTFMGIAYDLWL